MLPALDETVVAVMMVVCAGNKVVNGAADNVMVGNGFTVSKAALEIIGVLQDAFVNRQR